MLSQPSVQSTLLQIETVNRRFLRRVVQPLRASNLGAETCGCYPTPSLSRCIKEERVTRPRL
jgi:hypothetical protein